MLHCSSDNYEVKVVAAFRDHFECAMSLAFNGRQAQVQALYKDIGMVYLSYVIPDTKYEHLKFNFDGEFHTPIEIHKFPYTSVGEILTPAWNWLIKTAYPQKDIQSNASVSDKGFEIISHGRGFNTYDNSIWAHGAICLIKPTWLYSLSV